jgi:hypothetical protein
MLRGGDCSVSCYTGLSVFEYYKSGVIWSLFYYIANFTFISPYYLYKGVCDDRVMAV